MGQQCETGWRAIAEYAGRSIDEVKTAVITGDLRAVPKVQRRHIALWAKALRASEVARSLR